MYFQDQDDIPYNIIQVLHQSGIRDDSDANDSETRADLFLARTTKLRATLFFKSMKLHGMWDLADVLY